MAKDGTPPKAIRMTFRPESPYGSGNPSSQVNKDGHTPWFQTKKGAKTGWMTLSAHVFIGVSIWSWAPWASSPKPVLYFGVLFVFLALVMAIRMALLQKRNPLVMPEDLIKNAFGSLLLVLAGIAVPILLITLIVTIVILLLTW